MGGGLLDHVAVLISLHRLQGVDPAVYEAIVGLAVIGLIGDLNAITPQADAVVGIRQHRTHRPPADRTGSQLLKAEIWQQF